MGKIRVLRLLEYTYDSVETMEADMAHWTIPANGARNPGSTAKPARLIICSATLPLEVLLDVEPLDKTDQVVE